MPDRGGLYHGGETAARQAMGRIRSISRIHREIYALPEARHIDLRQYLRDLCAGLIEATLPPAGVRLKCDCEEAYMSRPRPGHRACDQ